MYQILSLIISKEKGCRRNSLAITHFDTDITKYTNVNPNLRKITLKHCVTPMIKVNQKYWTNNFEAECKPYSEQKTACKHPLFLLLLVQKMK